MAGDARRLAAAFERLDGTVQEMLAFLGTALDKGASAEGPWGPREVLAHVAYWHEFTCQALEEAVEGRSIVYPRENIDELNVRVVKLHADRPKADLLKELARLQARLREAVKGVKGPDAPAIVRPDGSTMTVLERLERADAHYRGHLAELKGS